MRLRAGPHERLDLSILKMRFAPLESEAYGVTAVLVTVSSLGIAPGRGVAQEPMLGCCCTDSWGGVGGVICISGFILFIHH